MSGRGGSMLDQPSPSTLVQNRSLALAPEVASNELPDLLAATLERRYLAGLSSGGWDLAPRPFDDAPMLLQEVTGLGRSAVGDAHAMPHVLTACHDPGHALVMVVQGEGGRQRLFFGGRRILG